MMGRLIVIGPLPPPHHGVTISTSLVLANAALRERFIVEHVDTSDHRSALNIGRWDPMNVRLGLQGVLNLLSRLGDGPGTMYLPISQSAPGFLRDSLFIHAAAARGWKVAAHLRGSEFRIFYGACSRPMRRWIRLSLSRLSSVAVMGAALRCVFDGLVPLERIAVVPNGTPDLEPDGAVRDPETVLFLGYLHRRKGIVESVEAALQVLLRRPSARFLFVGPWESPALERELRARTSAVDEAIRFLPLAIGDEKRNLLLSASVFLFPPAKPEGHPRVVLEALSAGLPVVTTDRGAIADSVVDGESGFVLTDPEPGEIADRLVRLLEDEPLRLRMAQSARARYLELFTQERADRALAEWLEAVAEGAAPLERSLR